MVTVFVKIGEFERRLEDAEESWINQEINRRRTHGEPVCVRVRIEAPSAKVGLTTPYCAGGIGGGRLPNADERRILDLWEQHRLNTAQFVGGNLIAFLRQLQRVL